MSELNMYSLPFVGLKQGEHLFNFKIKDEFFNEFKNSLIKKANLTIAVLLDKNSSFMKLTLKIDGFVNLICDRCSDFFDLELIDDHEIFVKNENERHSDINDDDTDIIYIATNQTALQLGQLFYEYITISLPLKQACALNENDKPICNKKLGDYYQIDKEEKKEVKKIDPRWSELEKLKNLNK